MDMTVRDDHVREEIMQVGGTPLRVAIRPGTGTGPPLLLCNGIGMRLEAFRPFVDALDPAIEVIRFDAPGVGGSQLPNRPYRFTTLAPLLREMLHNLGHQQADVLGISWGGGLAQQFALLNPRLCRRLILVATSTGPQTMVPPNPLPRGVSPRCRCCRSSASAPWCSPATRTRSSRWPTAASSPRASRTRRCTS